MLFVFLGIKAMVHPVAPSAQTETALLVYFHDYAVANADYLGSLKIENFKDLESRANNGNASQEEVENFYLNDLRFSGEMYDFVNKNSRSLIDKYGSKDALIKALETRYNQLISEKVLEVPGSYGGVQARGGCSWKFIKTIFISAGTAAAGCSTGIGCVGAGIVVGTMFADLCNDCC